MYTLRKVYKNNAPYVPKQIISLFHSTSKGCYKTNVPYHPRKNTLKSLTTDNIIQCSPMSEKVTQVEKWVLAIVRTELSFLFNLSIILLFISSAKWLLFNSVAL